MAMFRKDQLKLFGWESFVIGASRQAENLHQNAGACRIGAQR
jgi:hypothetical protein